MSLLTTRRALCREGQSRAQHPRSARRRRQTGVYVGLSAAKLPHLPSLVLPLPSSLRPSLPLFNNPTRIVCFLVVALYFITLQGRPFDTTKQSPKSTTAFCAIYASPSRRCAIDARPSFEELSYEYALYEFVELLSASERIGSRAAD